MNSPKITNRATIKGRGASFNPPNRFEELHVGPPPDDLVHYFEDPEFFLLTTTSSILELYDELRLNYETNLNPRIRRIEPDLLCGSRHASAYPSFLHQISRVRSK